MINAPHGRRLASTADDAMLMEAIAEQDLGALGILYDRHARAVWGAVHRVMNGSGDVDDVVHATFLGVPKLAKAFDGRPSARSWLVGIGVRLALRHLRTSARFARMLSRFAGVAPTAYRVDPETHAVARAELGRLERGLARLSTAKRAVFVLIEIEGLSHEEVARELKIPTGTVRTRLFSAKQELSLACE